MKLNYSAAGGVALLPCLLCACVDANGALRIQQAVVPDATTCSAPGSGAASSALLGGILDVGMDRDRPYFLYPVIANNLKALVGMGGGVEPNRIDVISAQVRIEAPPGVSVAWLPSCPVSFDWAVPLALEPGAAGGLKIEALRACHAAQLRQMFEKGILNPSLAEEVRFRVILHAKGKHGSSTLLSAPFEFPIRVCYGCLQTGYTDPDFVDFSASKVPPCDKLLANPYKGNPCNPSQDQGPILCCARDATGADLECPAVPRGAPPVAAP